MTVGIEQLRRRDPVRASVIADWLETTRDAYGDRMLPVSDLVAATWGRLIVPDPLPIIDGLMAATALLHGMTFVTRNTAGVARTGVDLLNPFDA